MLTTRGLISLMTQLTMCLWRTAITTVQTEMAKHKTLLAHHGDLLDAEASRISEVMIFTFARCEDVRYGVIPGMSGHDRQISVSVSGLMSGSDGGTRLHTRLAAGAAPLGSPASCVPGLH